jgi:hypothetical protein
MLEAGHMQTSRMENKKSQFRLIAPQPAAFDIAFEAWLYPRLFP